jgi:hypothetical protein
MTIIAEGDNISTVVAGARDSGYEQFALDFGPNQLAFRGNFLNVRVQVRESGLLPVTVTVLCGFLALFLRGS